MTDDRKDRVTQDEPTDGDPQSQPGTEAALANAQRLVSAAERFSRASQDDAATGSSAAETAGDPGAEASVPAEAGRPDQASNPDDGQPEPDLIPWLQTAEPVSRRKRRRAAGHDGDVIGAHASHARTGPGVHARRPPPPTAGQPGRDWISGR